MRSWRFNKLITTLPINNKHITKEGIAPPPTIHSHKQHMSYSQEVVLRMTIKDTLNGLSTKLTKEKLDEMLETPEGRAMLVDRLEIAEMDEVATIHVSPNATFVD